MVATIGSGGDLGREVEMCSGGGRGFLLEIHFAS